MISRHTAKAQSHRPYQRNGEFNLHLLFSFKWRYSYHLLFRRFARTDTRECSFQNRQNGLRIKITTQDQNHIGCHIVFFKELPHLCQARILQILCASDNRISIWMRSKIPGKQAIHHRAADKVAIHILLFINRFQFALEQTENRVQQTFAVYLRPLCHILRWKSIEIDSCIVRCCSIQPRTAILWDQTIEFIRYHIFGRTDA